MGMRCLSAIHSRFLHLRIIYLYYLWFCPMVLTHIEAGTYPPRQVRPAVLVGLPHLDEPLRCQSLGKHKSLYCPPTTTAVDGVAYRSQMPVVDLALVVSAVTQDVFHLISLLHKLRIRH